MNPSPTLFQRFTAVFRPGNGKRRKGRTLTAAPSVAAATYPPKPTHPPVYPRPTVVPQDAMVIDYGEIERMLMDRIAHDGFSVLSSFRDLYRVDVQPARQERHVRTAGTVTGRVVIRSNNPEMDAWVTRTAKTLVRPTEVPHLSPTQFTMPPVPAMRVRLVEPSPAPVSVLPGPRGMRGRSHLSVVSGGRTQMQDSQEDDLLLTDAWRNLFPATSVHVCRSCLCWGEGIVLEDGMWQCSRCDTTGRY